MTARTTWIITGEGPELTSAELAEADAAWRRMRADYLAHLTPAEIEQLGDGLFSKSEAEKWHTPRRSRQAGGGT